MASSALHAVLLLLAVQGAIGARLPFGWEDAVWTTVANAAAPAEAPTSPDDDVAPTPAPEPTPAPAPAPEEPPVVREFSIADDQFVRDGQPIRILSGSIHYARVHPELWEDRLRRVKSLGLNAIQTVVPWNLHEPQPGELNFEGQADLEAFIRVAQSLDLMVLLRVGPYICAEWDLGGLPSWLLTYDPKLKLRSSDPAFLAEVDAWWDVLLPRVEPLLWANGGPVVMVQVENEYGWFGNDTLYLRHLVNKTREHLGEDVVICTTDSATNFTLPGGTLEGEEVYTAIDAPVDADYEAAFALQKSLNAPGMSPPMTTEFYLGWFTAWGQPLPTNNVTLVAQQLDTILALNASINFYMAHGGTNFGFTSGANNVNGSKNTYEPEITSYDYTAPIGEGGDLSSPFYDAIRTVISKYVDEPLPTPPKVLPRRVFPTVVLNESASFIDSAPFIADVNGLPSIWPKEMEFFNQTSGFILFTATLPPSVKPTDVLTIFGVHDRVHVFVSTPAAPATPLDPSAAPVASESAAAVRRLVGTLERWVPKLKLPLAAAVPAPGDQIQVLVENMGHLNFGQFMGEDKKGVGAVMLNFLPLFHWTVHTLPLTNLSAVPFKPISTTPAPATAGFEPTFFRGHFSVSKPRDTFLSLRGWGKGVAFVNGFNLGRFWPTVGLQCHLYVPAPVLVKGENELIILELDAAPVNPTVSFTNATDFTCGPVPLTPPAPVVDVAVEGIVKTTQALLSVVADANEASAL